MKEDLYSFLYSLLKPFIILYPEIEADVWHNFIMSLISMILNSGHIAGFFIGITMMNALFRTAHQV